MFIHILSTLLCTVIGVLSIAVVVLVFHLLTRLVYYLFERKWNFNEGDSSSAHAATFGILALLLILVFGGHALGCYLVGGK